MNRVLILAQGKEARNFIGSIISHYLNVAEFDVIYQNESDILDEFKVDGIEFYKIPFSNFINFNFFKSKDYSKIIVVIKNRFFALNALKNLHYFIDNNILVEFIDFWGIEIQNPKIQVIKFQDIINSTLTDLLPNVPVFARNIGNGKEEIMQVEVPASSVFIYRSVEILNKEYSNKWRIVAIYRKGQLILPNKMTIIYPYDKILIIGHLKFLKDVYKSIKKDAGMFPAPYGKNIYLFIDNKIMNDKETNKLIKAALFLHSKLKSQKLIIRVINPKINYYFDKLRRIENIEVYIHYYQTNLQRTILRDFLKYSIGFFIIDNKFYKNNLEFLLRIKKPFLKLGDEDIKKCDFTGVMLENREDISSISPIVFDISSQLKTKIKFLDFDPENVMLEKKEIVEYYENLAKMYYYKNVEFLVNAKNPYFEIKKMKNICFFVPFNSKIPKNKLFSIISPNHQRIYNLLNDYNQFMIPTKD